MKQQYFEQFKKHKKLRALKKGKGARNFLFLQFRYTGSEKTTTVNL